MNIKQENFCREYILDGNASRAATAAGYSTKTSDRIGSRLLRNVEVAQEIERLKQEANAIAEAEAFSAFRDKRAILKSIIFDNKCATRDRIRAIEVDNVMAGDNAQTSREDTVIQPVICFGVPGNAEGQAIEGTNANS